MNNGCLIGVFSDVSTFHFQNCEGEQSNIFSLFPCVTSVVDIHEQLFFCSIYLGEPKGLHGATTVHTKAQILCYLLFVFSAAEQESSLLKATDSI